MIAEHAGDPYPRRDAIGQSRCEEASGGGLPATSVGMPWRRVGQRGLAAPRSPPPPRPRHLWRSERGRPDPSSAPARGEAGRIRTSLRSMGVPRHAGLPTSRHLHVLAVPDTPATGGAVGKGDTGVQLPDPSPAALSRRRFLQGAAATAGALAVGGLGRVRAGLAQTSVLPPPALSGIEHVVLLMMENRSFDHFLGWLAGPDGMQAGLTHLDRT